MDMLLSQEDLLIMSIDQTMDPPFDQFPPPHIPIPMPETIENKDIVNKLLITRIIVVATTEKGLKGILLL